MDRLKRRSDFVAAAKASRAGTKAFLLQARDRGEPTPGTPRIGFTVTRKIGGAVERNRIKRRLRALVRQDAAMAFRPGFDYVLVARREAMTLPYDELIKELAAALRRVHGRREPQARDETAGP